MNSKKRIFFVGMAFLLNSALFSMEQDKGEQEQKKVNLVSRLRKRSANSPELAKIVSPRSSTEIKRMAAAGAVLKRSGSDPVKVHKKEPIDLEEVCKNRRSSKSPGEVGEATLVKLFNAPANNEDQKDGELNEQPLTVSSDEEMDRLLNDIMQYHIAGEKDE